MAEGVLFGGDSAEVESLFPPKIELQCPAGRVKLEYLSGTDEMVLEVPEREIKVKIPSGSSSIQRVARIAADADPEFEEYLGAVSNLPREIHVSIIGRTEDIPEKSLEALEFLDALYREGPKWLDETLCIVGENNSFLAVEPKGTRKATVSATSLNRSIGGKAIRELSLQRTVSKNTSRYYLGQISTSAFRTAADAIEEEGYEEIAEAVRCASAYKSRWERKQRFEELENGLSKEDFEELKEKASNVRKKREREEHYDELYEEFKKKRYEVLPDKNEVLLYPRCVASIGLEVKIEKIKSERPEYHIASRINTGRWPPSVGFASRSEFRNSEKRELRESIKKAVDEIPESLADRLRAHAVDWILSETT